MSPAMAAAPVISAAGRHPRLRHTHTATASNGSTAATLIMAAAAKTRPAQRMRSRVTSRTPASTARPTHASLWAPFTTLTTTRGLRPTMATAAGLLVRRQTITMTAATHAAASSWKNRRAARNENPNSSIPAPDTAVNTGPYTELVLSYVRSTCWDHLSFGWCDGGVVYGLAW